VISFLLQQPFFSLSFSSTTTRAALTVLSLPFIALTLSLTVALIYDICIPTAATTVCRNVLA
jgi:hypothetical protein